MIAGLLCALAAHAQALPAIQTQALSGRDIELPAAAPATRTVLLLGFRKVHQVDFDAWRPALTELRQPGEVDWLELPFLDVPGLLKGIIGGAMNRTIDDPDVRERFAPVWASADPVREALGIESDERMVLVVLSDGEIGLRLDGPPTPEGIAQLTEALAPAPSK